MEELWCWLPSLSGRVFDEDNDFIAKLVEFGSSEDNQSVLGFEIMDHSNRDVFLTVKVRFTEGDCSKDVVIDVIDTRGLCRITYSGVSFFDVNCAWNSFRRALDGCSSTKYNCSSMRLPVFVGEGKDPVHILARKMLESVETNVDIISYAAGNSFRWTKKENPVCSPRAECDSNVLYFEAFMDLYADRFTDVEWKRTTEEMKRRARKMDVAHRHVECKEKHWFNRISVVLSITAIAVAIVAAIASLISLFVD